MPFTKEDLRNDIFTALPQYKRDLTLAPQTIDLYGDRATMDVFLKYWVTCGYRFVGSADFADQDPLSDDWIAPLNRQTLFSGEDIIPAFYASLVEIGPSIGNVWQLANENFPGYFICDQKINLLPPGSPATLKIYYIKRPKNLGDPTVDPTEESSMPDYMRPMIVATAVLLIMQVYGDRNQSLEITLTQISDYIKSLEMFVVNYNKFQTEEPNDIR